MVDLESVRNYLLSKPHVTEENPFGPDTLVYKVANKIFALISLNKWEQGDHHVNLKCNPDSAEELRDLYDEVQPAFHMNKKHWNTVNFNTDVLEGDFLYALIDDSYDLVVANLTKKVRATLNL